MDYLNGKNKTAYTIRQPLGVVLGITPFNFPLNLALHKLIPAIAVGAPIILKPAPQAPLTLLALANLLQNTELPKAAVNIIMTDNANAQKLVEDDRIKILSFTGSDKVGWMLKAISGKKKVLLEMGGNAAAIIDSSANLQRAARKLVYGSFLNAGQICISTQRIYVLENVYEQFMQYFIEETQKVQSGDMRNENVINSSMISVNDVKRIQQWIDEAVEQGAKILTGGKILDAKANIFEPTILTNTNISMKVNAEEAFAPVVIIEKVSGFEQAVDLVNESKYGLQAAVFTDSLQNILKAQTDLDVGGVIINDVPGFRIDAMPYGGIKDSGVGREGAKYVMQEFTEPKLIVLS
jgi:glyceraldehyde-3-phosphate dehydrogenase (NADP+)